MSQTLDEDSIKACVKLEAKCDELQTRIDEALAWIEASSPDWSAGALNDLVDDIHEILEGENDEQECNKHLYEARYALRVSIPDAIEGAGDLDKLDHYQLRVVLDAVMGLAGYVGYQLNQIDNEEWRGANDD